MRRRSKERRSGGEGEGARRRRGGGIGEWRWGGVRERPGRVGLEGGVDGRASDAKKS